ncbi:MAG TPA: hypothetical protein DHV85_00540 [Candidatus Accumulibacter sp.]|nr:hypothetical protein [Accumulibacter sp.]
MVMAVAGTPDHQSHSRYSVWREPVADQVPGKCRRPSAGATVADGGWPQAVARSTQTSTDGRQQGLADALCRPCIRVSPANILSYRDGLALEEAHASRLFAIDAGLDSDALRARYPDRSRHLILRGTVRPIVRQHDEQHHLAGYLDKITIGQINVPFALRPLLEPLRDIGRPAPAERTPRYQVQIVIGQRLEPWIESLSSLPADSRTSPSLPAP